VAAKIQNLSLLRNTIAALRGVETQPQNVRRIKLWSGWCGINISLLAADYQRPQNFRENLTE
jgi:hypothetical protein